jgi:hypothetical protein
MNSRSIRTGLRHVTDRWESAAAFQQISPSIEDHIYFSHLVTEQNLNLLQSLTKAGSVYMRA